MVMEMKCIVEVREEEKDKDREEGMGCSVKARTNGEGAVWTRIMG